MFERISNLWPKKPIKPDGKLAGQVTQNQIRPKSSKLGRTLKGKKVINDADIKVRVIAALLANPQTDRALIRVKSEQGVVILDGQVETWAIKVAARLVAGRQKDVRGVVDKIMVRAFSEESNLSVALATLGDKNGKTTTIS